ncbi:CD70 antigen [Echinops telfairi]|uniref:CD70 antigen n=1 Tax=Echinops telfairi TaxID=9371 RepID=A0ABM0J445_ECHTE|nr:CD70 antigen [Echinops telfairi]
MADEGAGWPVWRLPWMSRRCIGAIGAIGISLLGVAMVTTCFCLGFRKSQDSQEQDVAELQLNHTGQQWDPNLRWQAGPALGRSFLHGPMLKHGQLHIQHDGIYRLHIQVTLANCSFPRRTTPRKPSLSVGICAPATHSVSLIRRSFHHGCTVTSQRLTRLARGDTLCTNLTVPLQVSSNADETFFGIQWVHP